MTNDDFPAIIAPPEEKPIARFFWAYKGYCPFCDEGFSAEQDDISYMMGNPYIECPACGQNIILPSLDTNQSLTLDQDELRFWRLNNPNYLKLEFEEEDIFYD